MWVYVLVIDVFIQNTLIGVCKRGWVNFLGVHLFENVFSSSVHLLRDFIVVLVWSIHLGKPRWGQQLWSRETLTGVFIEKTFQNVQALPAGDALEPLKIEPRLEVRWWFSRHSTICGLGEVLNVISLWVFGEEHHVKGDAQGVHVGSEWIITDTSSIDQVIHLRRHVYHGPLSMRAPLIVFDLDGWSEVCYFQIKVRVHENVF